MDWRDNKTVWQKITITIEYKPVANMSMTVKNEDSFLNTNTYVNLFSQKNVLNFSRYSHMSKPTNMSKNLSDQCLDP